MGGRGAQRPVLDGSEFKKTGARTRGQNPLVYFIIIFSLVPLLSCQCVSWSFTSGTPPSPAACPWTRRHSWFFSGCAIRCLFDPGSWTRNPGQTSRTHNTVLYFIIISFPCASSHTIVRKLKFHERSGAFLIRDPGREKTMTGKKNLVPATLFCIFYYYLFPLCLFSPVPFWSLIRGRKIQIWKKKISDPQGRNTVLYFFI